MKFSGMPLGMWMLYKNSFCKHLVSELGFAKDTANRITKQAKPKYREIIEKLPEFINSKAASIWRSLFKMGLMILLSLLPTDFVLEPLGQFVFGRQFHFFRLGKHRLPNLAITACQICFRRWQNVQFCP